MRESAKTLHFPTAGLNRSLSFRSATLPSDSRVYATPFAENVRGTDVFGGRFRGGSRPGLVPVEESIPAPEIYERPTAFFRGRKVYAEGGLWYASRSGVVDDFDFGGDGDDPSRPCMGKVGFVSFADAETITAIFSVSTSAVYVATKRSLWVCSGELTTGAFSCVSEFVGIVSKDAWCFDGTVFYLVSANGIYFFSPERGAVRASDDVPEEIKEMTSAICAYDPENHALHVFSDTGDWYFDIAAKAWWPQHFVKAVMRPVAVTTAVVGALHKPVFYGEDGVWRAFDDGAAKDDGDTDIRSCVAIGPVRCAAREDMDGMMDSFSAMLANASGEVGIELYAGKTAEDSVSSVSFAEPDWECSVGGGYNHKLRPRIRGAWVTVLLRSSSPWAFESMTAVTKALGGLR